MLFTIQKKKQEKSEDNQPASLYLNPFLKSILGLDEKKKLEKPVNPQ
ncbi:hypothetical protein [Flavobacterium silvaticum]|uniref:Uncharacterized protein n=1 Tax=Flavobacterium silvaticum TaxID=1852020 RepID=A0A972JG31_9FLAO|nr:hypothetical protein [Flavobacterium silvaticum]NMH28619.1 hypothetical protein [Flavobacterium silvaticum]